MTMTQDKPALNLEPAKMFVAVGPTRTDRLKAAIMRELDAFGPQIDADEGLSLLIISVKVNNGGYPRRIEIDRKSGRDFSDERK